MGYDTSLFERLQRGGHSCHLLRTQYRMHPSIRRFPSTHFYRDMLRDGECIRDASRVPCGEPRGAPAFLAAPGDDSPAELRLAPYLFFNVLDGEQHRSSGSRSLRNDHEARFCAKMLSALLAASNAHRQRLAAAAAAEREQDLAAAGGGAHGADRPLLHPSLLHLPLHPYPYPSLLHLCLYLHLYRSLRPHPCASSTPLAPSARSPGGDAPEEGEITDGDATCSGVSTGAAAAAPSDVVAAEWAPGIGGGCSLGPGRSCAYAGLCGRVAILTPYKEQCRAIEEQLCVAFGTKAGWGHAIEVGSVDAYQGKEKDVILFSCVRSGRGGGLGFVKDLRRLNVALTRARHALYIVGSEASLEQSTDWRALLSDARARKCVRDVTVQHALRCSPDDFLRSIPLSLLDGSWVPTAQGEHVQPPPCRAVVLSNGWRSSSHEPSA